MNPTTFLPSARSGSNAGWSVNTRCPAGSKTGLAGAARRNHGARRRVGSLPSPPLATPLRGLDFEDDREDQGALRGVLIDVALQIHPDLFLYYAPVGLFFRIGLLDGLEHNFAG